VVVYAAHKINCFVNVAQLAANLLTRLGQQQGLQVPVADGGPSRAHSIVVVVVHMRDLNLSMSKSAVLLLLLTVQAAAAGSMRSLQQQEALSNSNGCLDTIPKCEPGACVTKNIMGVARWACLRCLANYAPVVDASGQDNIIQCGESTAAAAAATPALSPAQYQWHCCCHIM
jgi:hypothetical protein